MKNIKLIIAALISFAALSCEKESLPQSNSETDKIPLILTTGEDTKTSLQSDGAIHWSTTDKLAVFDNSIMGDNKNEFVVSAISDANHSSATFSGRVGSTTSVICAVYPYEMALSCEVGTLSSHKNQVNLPSQQSAKAGSFAENLNISVAKASVLTDTDKNGLPETSISFKNVCALLSFTLPNSLPEEITNVTISSAIPMAGKMSLTYGDNITCSLSNDQPTRISMTGTFEPGKTYWFVVAPVKLKGISIDVETKSGNIYTKSNSSEITLTQGKYRSLGTLNFDKMKPITVSSEHECVNNTLLGTNLSVNLPYSDISAINLTVKLGDKVVRTITDTKDVDNGVAKTNYDAAGNWPYLPCGDYNISGSYTTGFGTVNVDYSFSISEGPEKLNITSVNAYTSYTKYLESGADAANKCDGTSIYLNQISGISGDILKQSHYSPYLKAKFDSGSEIQAFFESAGEYRFSMYAYRQYNNVLLIFDGVKSSSDVSLSECHVTGLPYTLKPASKDSVNPWVGNTSTGSSWVQTINYYTNVKWNDNGSLRLGYNFDKAADGLSWDILDPRVQPLESSVITKTFHVPSNINVVVNSTGSAVGTGQVTNLGLWGSRDDRKNTKYDLRVSGGSVFYYTTTNGKEEQSFSSGDKGTTITAATPTVQMENTYSASTACSRIKSLTINYR